MWAEAVLAPLGQLEEGHRVGDAAGDVDDGGKWGGIAARRRRRRKRGGLIRNFCAFCVLLWLQIRFEASCHLLHEEGDEVSGVEAVADLLAGSAEADVFERATGPPTVDPVGEDPLVGLAKLAGSGQDAAAVDPDGKVKGGAVFERKQLGTELRGPVEADRRGRGEGFGKTGGGNTGNFIAARRRK